MVFNLITFFEFNIKFRLQLLHLDFTANSKSRCFHHNIFLNELSLNYFTHIFYYISDYLYLSYRITSPHNSNRICTYLYNTYIENFKGIILFLIVIRKYVDLSSFELTKFLNVLYLYYITRYLHIYIISYR